MDEEKGEDAEAESEEKRLALFPAAVVSRSRQQQCVLVASALGGDGNGAVNHLRAASRMIS